MYGPHGTNYDRRMALKADVEGTARGTRGPTGRTIDSDGLVRLHEKVWVPNSHDAMKIKLLTISHAG